MTKVLFISHYAGVGGANLSLLFLIKSLRKFKIDPIVFIPTNGPIVEYFKKEKIPYEIHHYASLRTADKGPILNFISAIIRVAINLYLSLILGLKLKNKINIIHSNSSLVFFGLFIKKIIHKPLIWHLREFGKEDYGLIFPLGSHLSGWCYNQADKVIAISDAMKDYFHQIYNGGNMITIYNGIDESTICYHPKTLNISPNRKLKLCIVGGINDSKNQIELIEAIHLLKRKDTLQVDIIGSGESNYISYLQQKVKEYQLENIINFAGHISNIGDILTNYDIGVITSKKEAFGRVTIEYMLAGVCVIASRSGANIELIENKKTGLLYNLGSNDDLAFQIELLQNNPEIRINIANNARQKALNNYTASNNAIQIFRLYNQLFNVQA